MFARHRVLRSVIVRTCEPGDLQEEFFSYHDVKDWPAGVIEGLIEAGLLRPALIAESVPCPGCEERCLRPLVLASSSATAARVALIDCHMFTDRGPFEIATQQREQWTSRRQFIAEFFSRAAKLAIKDRDPQWRRVKLQDVEVSGARRSVSMELLGEASLVVGSSRFALADFLDWDGCTIKVDHRAIEDLVLCSPDLQLGGKRHQHSTVVREDSRVLTQLRNRRLQRLIDDFAWQHPKLSKLQLAKLVERSGKADGVKATTIARITRMPKKN